ncbi:MAG: NAD-binding protein [Burkholderiales bacterium]|nr:NAD-binding protein [Burkholderiales bacterium]
MRPEAPTPTSPARALRRLGKRMLPQVPLALVIVAAGVFNIVDGAQLGVPGLQAVSALGSLSSELSTLGSTAQVILGVLRVLAGAGLLWHLVAAWTVSVVLLMVTLAVNVAQWRWGAGFVLQALLLTTLLLTRRHFTRSTIVAQVLFSVSGILGVLCYGALGSFLFGQGFNPPIRDWATAFYFTVVTLSTVGYGDISPVSPHARLFAISLLVFGLGVFASAIASAVGPKLAGEFSRLFKPKETRMQFEDHIILVGEGAIALNTADELTRRGAEFVRIVETRAGSQTGDDHVVEGDATDEKVLQGAGIRRARLLIAAREDDGENAFIVLGAKELNPELKVLAVASSPRPIRRLKLARADLVFSPAAVGSRLLADVAQGRPVAPEFDDLLDSGHAPAA